jgi:hypothetical protein
MKAKSEDNVIDKFSISCEEGYAAFWRRDKSPVEVMELAKLLRALRKVGSLIGSNLGTIVWSGMDYKNGIALDPSPILGAYPVPAVKADIMVGITVRKALEKTEWSERLKNMALQNVSLPPHYAYKLTLFLDMCEQVYLDCVSNRSTLGLYTQRAREWQYMENARQFLQPPTLTHLLHLWWRIAADRGGEKYKEQYVDRTGGDVSGKTDLTNLYGSPLALLNSIIEPLIHECRRIDGVSERCEYRLGLYMSIWPALLQFVKFWPGDRSDPFLLPDSMREQVQNEEEEKKALLATIVGYARQIESAIREKQPSYTDEVRANVTNMDDVVEIEGNDIMMRASNKVDRQVLHKLRLIIKSAAQRRTVFNRGLTSGKIDRRRLHRAPTAGTIFHLKKDQFELLNDIVIIVDATGSMADPNKWDRTETILQTLFSAVRTYNPGARMFAYNEVKDKCHLTEIFLFGDFFTVLPNGKTASGEAIIATALNLKVRNKRPFLIHITDGASNWGCGVSDAIAFCKKKKINLLTLGIGCSPAGRQSLKKEYGSLVQFIDKIDELPNLFGSLIRCTNWQ